MKLKRYLIDIPASVAGTVWRAVVSTITFSDFDFSLFLFVESSENTGHNESSSHDESGEVILSSKILKAYNSVHGYSINETYYCWQHLHIQLRHKEWAFLGVNFDEMRLSMLSRNSVEMHIDNLAPLEVLVIEMHNNKSGLGDHLEELILGNLGVLSVAVGDILGMLDLLLLHGSQSDVSHRFHDMVVTVAVVIVIAVVLELFIIIMADDIALVVFHLLLHLDSFVFDSFLHDHLVEEFTLHLHCGAGFFTHFKIQIFYLINYSKNNL